MSLVYTTPTFEAMPKIARLNKQVVMTEKLDGANALIAIEVLTRDTIESAGCEIDIQEPENILLMKVQDNGDHWILRAGGKNRWLIPAVSDNYGFAAWAFEHAEELLELGPGTHRGEFWGKGIYRNYGLDERRFSLFNVSRWVSQNAPVSHQPFANDEKAQLAPKCCHVVPVMAVGTGFEGCMQGLQMLKENGSLAAPGFMNPEGICVYHSASQTYYKATIENDGGKFLEVVDEQQA